MLENNIYFQILTFSSLILFNIFAVVGIVAFVVIIRGVTNIKLKVGDTMERIQDSALNIGEAGLNFASVISQFAIFKPKRGIRSFLANIFRE
jgi:hypothetical protein